LSDILENKIDIFGAELRVAQMKRMPRDMAFVDGEFRFE